MLERKEKLYLHLICFALLRWQQMELCRGRRVESRKWWCTWAGVARWLECGQDDGSSRDYGVTRARISSQFTSPSSSSTLLSLLLLLLLPLYLGYLYLNACMYICLCVALYWRICVLRKTCQQLTTTTTIFVTTTEPNIIYTRALSHTHVVYTKSCWCKGARLLVCEYASVCGRASVRYSLNICG